MMIQTGNLYIFRLHTRFFYSFSQTFKPDDENIIIYTPSQPATHFLIVNKFYIFCWKESFVGLSLPQTAFFIYFRSVLSRIVEVNKCVKFKTRCRRGEWWVCVLTAHYQLWLIAILESCDPFMLLAINVKLMFSFNDIFILNLSNSMVILFIRQTSATRKSARNTYK